ncbi:myocardin related transcription factor Ab isoform X4 [Rhinichthys klamathensis goyatoka]|uniref:myocardin related transcription factor Ab isoform X4 n=1 Tax=Rhinichthys klamathensis goyatoka TaxID=3034132 RepID=UPI0024B50F98|nr:myocardin related transcription factor Ab isoform X4 [Rhinichthys klamathensis goyatoka]
MVSALGNGSVPSPQSEAVASELQELTLQSVPSPLPLKERKNVLQLKLQQRRTREELVSQGIMPPLKSPAAFHEQRKSLERARTEDYLKRKIRSRPERSELVRMHILEETSAEPSLQAKQLKLKRARLADDLNDKISHRPGPIELIHKNILPVHALIGTESPKGESSSLDEDSSDALSPDPQCSQDSPLGLAPQHSPSDMLNMNGDLSPSQFLTQAPPPPLVASDASPPQNLTSEFTITNSSRPPTGHTKLSKSSTDRISHRSKKAKDNKPKVKKLKYHQYIPPDQKNDREPPPQLDSSYAKILHQQQLFLQLQIINQQQQHYNYHTILPAPPKLPAEKQQPSTNLGPSPSQTISTCSTVSSNQNGPNRQSQPTAGGAKPSTLPPNLDEFKVAELKQELKLRGLTVSGTKNDLIERLKNYQEQNNGSSAAGAAAMKTVPAQLPQVSVQSSGAPPHQNPKDTAAPVSAFSIAATTRLHSTTPPQIMRFSSTSSSPPVSPTPSDRSLAGLSPDETSCNGDVFGEMVSSPLTQLSLHPSPDHRSPIKEESLGQMQASCSLSRPGLLPVSQRQDPGPVAASGTAVLSLDKDQMLQEKDKQIEELTRMLRQKQRLVETLRSQLEQGKRGSAAEVADNMGNAEIPLLSNGLEVRVKEEVKEEMDTSEDLQKQGQPLKKIQTQCSQQTLLKLQQIHRLQVQQQQMLVDLPNIQTTQLLQQQKQQQQSDPQKLQQEQGKTRVLQLHKQQKAQLLQQQKLQLLQQQQKVKLLQQQQQKTLLQQQQKTQMQQQKKTALLQQQQQQKLQQLIIQQSQQKQLQTNQKQQQTPQNQQLQTPQVSQVFINQPSGTQITTSFPLDLLKAHSTPTLVTDSNGNRYLIALTSNSVESLTGKSPQSKSNGRITLQRLQSTPSKLPSQSSADMASSANQSQAVKEPIPKVQKKGLHLETTSVQESSQPVSAPPSFEPFFCEESNPLNKPSSPPSFKEDICPTFDQHTLFTPSSPKPNKYPPQRFKDNVSNNQQIDDLFDILIKSGEISSGFKASQDPSLLDFHSSPPTPSPPPPLHLSPPTHQPDPVPAPSQQLPDTQDRPCSRTVHLEDFLESTTSAPLLGVEPDGPLTLIDDLHNQMLSTYSILDHPQSPMDTSDMSFSPHPANLDFEDPTLDSMDWLDIPGVGGGSNCNGGGMVLAPLSSHTPPSVFSADFLDSSDLQIHWDSCL